ncbi:MAG: hypothetical protein U5K69_21920 [Balneolaceae bacterium]|nr:hypothetical protein [Balneolaceae bacterium]
MLVWAPSINAQQVQSDYQIQKSFKEDIKSVDRALQNVNSSAEVADITQQIAELDSTYSDHQKLINSAIYPATFQEQMQELRQRATLISNRLATIEEQEEKLNELTDKLADYGTKLSRLDQRTDSLQTAVSQSVESEKQLSAQLRDYRNSLEQRDELILSFIDSVVVTYRDIGISTLSDVENNQVQSRLSEGNNPLELIRSIPERNLQLIESNTKLAAVDYLRMNAVQDEFANMWSAVGRKLSEAYSSNPDEVQNEIQQQTEAWESAVHKRMWSSMHQTFKQTGLDIAEFSDSTSMFAELNNFVEQGITQSEEGSSTESYEQYQAFNNFWNDHVKKNWMPHLIRGETTYK